MLLFYFEELISYSYLFSFQILTKDSVTIFVNAIMYYRVKVGI